MSLAIISSIAIRLVAAIWSVMLLRRMGDWRMLFLTVMLLLMATRQMLTVVTAVRVHGEPELTIVGHLAAEVPGLIVSVMALLSVLFLGRMLAAQRRAEERHAFTQFAVDHSSEIALWTDREGRLIYVNDAACRRLGRSREELLSMKLSDIDVAVPPNMWQATWRAAKRRRSSVRESCHRTGDGAVFPVEISSTYQRFEGREYLCSFARDISERRLADERQRLLMRELDHRVRNNVASLGTLIDLTAAVHHDVGSFAESMRGRVRGMAGIHELLSRDHWQPVSLERMVERLVPVGTLGTIRMQGPAVRVPADRAVALAMVINELMTNSLKHGASSTPEGAVEIGWTFDQQTQACTISWVERGGPRIGHVDPAPSVGTQLIEGLVRSDLRGEPELRYRPDGVAHRITVSLDAEDAAPRQVARAAA